MIKYTHESPAYQRGLDSSSNRALYFLPPGSYPLRMSKFSFGTTYYYGFFGYSRWGPRSRVQ
jgi:hypothetical protein